MFSTKKQVYCTNALALHVTAFRCCCFSFVVVSMLLLVHTVKLCSQNSCGRLYWLSVVAQSPLSTFGGGAVASIDFRWGLNRLYWLSVGAQEELANEWTDGDELCLNPDPLTGEPRIKHKFTLPNPFAVLRLWACQNVSLTLCIVSTFASQSLLARIPFLCFLTFFHSLFATLASRFALRPSFPLASLVCFLMSVRPLHQIIWTYICSVLNVACV